MIDVDHEFWICLDCEKHFKLIAGKTVSNFETHLRGQAHKLLADARIEKQRQAASFISTSEAVDSEIPTKPLVVSGQNEHSYLAQSRLHYLAALEQEASQNHIWMASMRKRLSNLETNSTGYAEQTTKLLELSRIADEKYQWLIDTNARNEEKQRTVTNKHKERLSQMEQQISSLEDAQTNRGRILDEHFETFEEKQSNRVAKLEHTLKEFEEHVQDQLRGTTRRIARAEKKEQADVEDIRDTLTSDLKKRKDLYQILGENREQSTKLSEKLKHLEALTASQETIITDLESRFQIESAELQRQKENEEAMWCSLQSQMTAHYEQTDLRIKAIEKSSEERLERFTKRLLERLHARDQLKSERIRSLEKETSEQKATIERFEMTIPAILEELSTLHEAILPAEEEKKIEDERTKNLECLTNEAAPL